MAKTKEELNELKQRCERLSTQLKELSEDELSQIIGGMFVDYKFGVVYYSASEWHQMSTSEQQMMRLFFDGDVKICVLPDEDYEKEFKKYNGQ